MNEETCIEEGVKPAKIHACSIQKDSVTWRHASHYLLRCMILCVYVCVCVCVCVVCVCVLCVCSEVGGLF